MVAAFASSSSGLIFGATCQRFGVDPASYVEDDVLGVNLRIALAMSLNADDEDEEQPESEFERARRIHAEAFGG